MQSYKLSTVFRKRSTLGLNLALLVSLCSVQASAQTQDIYASVTQHAIDRVLSDIHYPLTIIDEHYPPCVSGLNAPITQATHLRPEARAELIAFAKKRQPIPKFETPDDNIATRIDNAVAGFYGTLAEVDAQRDQVEKQGNQWRGPSKNDVDQIRQRGIIDFAFCLPWLRVDLRSSPKIVLSASVIPVTNIDLSVGATGEVYGYWADFICDNHCIDNICCWGHLENHWHYIGSLTVTDVHLKANGKVMPGIDPPRKVFLQASVDSLRLDYEILKEIPLEGFANNALAGKKFEVLDADKIVAALPYVNNKYGIDTLKLSGSGELRVDISLRKLP